MIRTTKRYIPTLDGWRAIAITLVMLFHLELLRGYGLSTSWFYSNGGSGVEVFFAISGLLICTLLLDEERNTGTISLGGFYFRRAFRILPAAVTYLCVVALLRALGTITSLQVPEWIASLGFYRSFLPHARTGWYTNHFWSLSVEEHFYLILPLFLVVCKRHRGLILGVVGLLTLSSGFLLSHFRLVPGWAEGLSDFRLGSLFLSAGFAASMLDHAVVKRLAGKATAPFLALAAAFAAVTFVHDRIAAVVIPFLVLAAVACTVMNPTNLLGKILENGVLRFIGKRSYSLYLWQQLFLSVHFGPGKEMVLQQWPLSLLCTFGCACLSYSFVEQPLIRKGRAILRKRSERRDESLVAAS